MYGGVTSEIYVTELSKEKGLEVGRKGEQITLKRE
jgi:hypothetical protein